jgi:hypothetical protein
MGERYMVSMCHRKVKSVIGLRSNPVVHLTKDGNNHKTVKLLELAKQTVEQKKSVQKLQKVLNALYHANTVEDAQAALLANEWCELTACLGR